MGLMDDAKGMADSHDKEVDQGIEKAGDLADSKTGNKYKDQVDKGEDLLQEKTGGGDTTNPPK
ncbi:MAG: antitoxin [Actinomycetota bacterium]|nr:antitoxin [Actinomycetota bacterium]